MGRETSYKLRPGAPPPDSDVGRRAVELGLITQAQLTEALERATEDPAVPNQTRPTLADALVSCHFLTQQQVDVLLEGRAAFGQIGRYRLGRKLGRGGMGVVFEAIDRDLNRKVAIKMLRVTSDAEPSEIAEDEERFIREARLSAKLPKHPHIVSVYEAGVIGGRRFIAMELIEGIQFQEWRSRKTTPLRKKIAVLRDVARAVEHAHRHGVIHRDLKPANILIDADEAPHVTDFGLAKQIAREGVPSLTDSGFLLGTPAYVSPEQAQGWRQVDHRTDVWALGIMLYEILTDRLPFQGINPLDIVLKTIRDPVPDPASTTRPGTLAASDRALTRICLRALAKKPEERYPTAGAMADDLTRWLEGRRVIASAPRRSIQGWKIAAAAGGLLVVLAMAFWFVAPADDASARGRRAEQFVAQGRKHLAQNRPTDALYSFGRALEEDSGCRAAIAGKKEAQEKIMAAARAEAKPVPVLPPDFLAGIAELAPLRGHTSGVHLVAFSPDGRGLLTGSFDNTVRLWDLASRSEPRRLAESGAMPVSVATSPDGRWMAAGFLDSSLRIWDGRGNPTGSFPGHRLQVTGVAFSPDGRSLVSTSTDGSARFWETSTGALKLAREGFPKGAMSLSMSRDGNAIAVGSAESLIRVLRLPAGDEIATLDRVHADVVRGVAFSPDGKKLASAGHDGNVVLVELDSGRRQTLSGHSKEVIGVTFSPDGRWLVSTSLDRTLRAWDARTGVAAGVIRAGTGFFGVAFSADGETMAAGMGDSLVRLWSLKPAK